MPSASSSRRPAREVPSIIVVERRSRFTLHSPEVEVVEAREYLSDPRFSELAHARVYNLCRSYAYQSLGYYVSLLAGARGHRPLPSVSTVQEARMQPLLRIVSDDVAQIVARALKRVTSDRFEMSIYFGRALARAHDALARALFAAMPLPMSRAAFSRVDGEWRLDSLRPIAADDVPEAHVAFVSEQFARYFSKPTSGRRRPRFDLAILVNEADEDRPSDEAALRKFIRAADRVGIRATLVSREDYASIGEYDALFIRETTRVNHHTYRFASRATALGLVVIDCPESILRCSNKVYQAELFARGGVPTPKSKIIMRGQQAGIADELGLPCVLKQPDSSFSLGVHKAHDRSELSALLKQLFARSDLLVAQEVVSSEFDWRIGVLAGEPLFAVRYYMAPGHWKIMEHKDGERSYGRYECVPMQQVPPRVLRVALKACRLISQGLEPGLYGVDLKEVDGRPLVIEVNDNPNIDSDIEDKLLGDEVYARVLAVFLARLERRSAREVRAAARGLKPASAARATQRGRSPRAG